MTVGMSAEEVEGGGEGEGCGSARAAAAAGGISLFDYSFLCVNGVIPSRSEIVKRRERVFVT